MMRWGARPAEAAAKIEPLAPTVHGAFTGSLPVRERSQVKPTGTYSSRGDLDIASFAFIVDQRQNAMVFRLGEVVKVEKPATKVPLLDNVRFDTRILHRHSRALPHFGKEARAGRPLREVADHRRAFVLRQRGR
jgi:hypothetical protein